MEYKELQESFNKLEEQLKTKVEAVENKEEPKPEQINYETEIKALKERIKELEIEVAIGDDKYEKLNEKVQSFKKKKKEKESELREVEEKLEHIQGRYAETLQEIESIKKASQPVTNADLSRKSSMGNVDVENHEKSPFQVQHLQIEIKKLNDHLALKDEELKATNQKIDNSNKELENVKKELEKKEKDIKDLQVQLDNSKEHKGKGENLEAQLEQLRQEKNKEIERLQKLLETSESQNEDKMTLLIQQEKKLLELEEYILIAF